ncbi:MBOAT family protein [uncultured Roseovarius sp.]|uniref:MBOAT family O-acyltransferase n=1 Tax=uncultured Roseovarius sp. TaxID=293344 RepID=UPI00260C1135|nr:MBOAT family protein [uncultured Roseovarius sp.]
MVFPTLDFILFFAVVLSLALWIGRDERRAALRKGVLIAASYTFYAAWDARFLLLMAGVSALAWGAGLWVRDARRGRRVLVVALALMLLTLGVFKYFNFFFLSLQQLLGDSALARDLAWMRVILPVGISFYIFQAISYLLDIRRGKIAPRHNPIDVFLYISFFPQLVAGPIVRAADFLPQIDRPAMVDATMRGAAVLLILTGLFKKMVVANYLSVLLVDPVFAFPDLQGRAEALLAVVGYGVQIYCDFSGYSDIAIGVALLMGYRFKRNFNQPYRARGLSDFWRRWHISLSTWIRDYLYIPLGGNAGGALRQIRTVMITMTLAGLWHGAGWNFLIWGLLHGAGLVAERGMARLRMLKPLAILSAPLTLVFVLALWIPFRAADWQGSTAIIAAMGRTNGPASVEISTAVLALVAIGLAMNWLPMRWRDAAEARLIRFPPLVQALCLALGTVICFALAQDGVAPFIYFQF